MDGELLFGVGLDPNTRDALLGAPTEDVTPSPDREAPTPIPLKSPAGIFIIRCKAVKDVQHVSLSLYREGFGDRVGIVPMKRAVVVHCEGGPDQIVPPNQMAVFMHSKSAWVEELGGFPMRKERLIGANSLHMMSGAAMGTDYAKVIYPYSTEPHKHQNNKIKSDLVVVRGDGDMVDEASLTLPLIHRNLHDALQEGDRYTVVNEDEAAITVTSDTITRKIPGMKAMVFTCIDECWRATA